MRSRFLVELAVVAAALWEERPRARPASPCGGWLSPVPLERAIEIRFGARAGKGPDLVRDIKAIIATKIPLYAVAEDPADRGIQKLAAGPLRHRATTEGCTMATLFTPLSARYTLQSAVATMLRTTPPPEGIGVLENFFVRGSNLTTVFGSMPDSLNQTVPSGVTAIPYGLAPAPPGEGHSSTFREAGLNRPSWPRA